MLTFHPTIARLEMKVEFLYWKDRKMSIEKDDGNWVVDPSGLKSGDLKGWRDQMYEECPNPKVGDIVVVLSEKQGKKIGYKATTAEGYDTRWLRVSSVELEKYFSRIEASINDSDSILFGRTDLLCDRDILNSMESLASEGFDDEILADFANQMSKG